MAFAARRKGKKRTNQCSDRMRPTSYDISSFNWLMMASRVIDNSRTDERPCDSSFFRDMLHDVNIPGVCFKSDEITYYIDILRGKENPVLILFALA